MKIALRSVELELEEVVTDILKEQGGLSELLLEKQLKQPRLIDVIIDKLNLINEEGYDKHIVNDIKDWLDTKRVDSVGLGGLYKDTIIVKYEIDNKEYIYIYGGQ